MRRVKFKLIRTSRRGRRHSIFAEGSYDLEYPKGAIVRAREETLGVSVFKTKKQAEVFQDRYFDLTMIHVRTIGRGRTVRLVCTDPREIQLDIFYSNKPSYDGYSYVSESRVPPGTIFYPAVEVLD